VILDLNGTSLHGPGVSNSAIGVLVSSRHSVTIQNGDIDGFGLAGIELLANSAQNIVDNVRLNANQTGVLAVFGTLNIVKKCVIDGGSVGILFSSGSGNRASNNTLGNQGPPMGIALLTLGSSQNYFENNLVFKGFNASGQVMAGGINDKYRFETFVGFPIVHPVSGGIQEFANSL
jgi:Right handed beta helix region